MIDKMSSLTFIYLLSGFLLGVLWADNRDDIKQDYNKIMNECMQTNPLTENDIKAMEQEDKKTQNVKCIFACALRKTGMMDEKGMFSPEGVRKSTETFLPNDPVMKGKSEKLIEACKGVNDAPVSDGEKGCDRALLIYECTIQKAHNFELF